MDQAVGTIGFDRSRVRILLCDKDPATAQEVKDLLCRCSYQVSVVKSARQVVEVLNLVDSKVDLVLAEVELPNGKGFKMLRHIVKTETFKHIPIVMMSARDEMAIVVKCLRLGAADYLVKPLRINELLNLWTHMWRRRRMLGLTEKHIVKGHLATKNIIAEIFVSDTSESNTISTDILSEDSNDALFKAKESNLRTISEEQQLDTSPELELTLTTSKENRASEVSGRKLSPPRRTELKLGQSSAFLSYAKAVSRTTVTERPESTKNEGPSCSNSNVQPPLQLNEDNEKQLEPAGRAPRNREVPAAAEVNQFHPEVQWNNASASRNEGPVQWNDEAARRHEGGDQYSVMQVCPQNTGAIYNQLPQSHLIPQLMVAHSLHHPSTLLQPALHYYQAVQPENVAAMHSAPAAFSYYPFPIHVPPHQVGPWATTLAAQSANERKAGAERREAALKKFRQKRKDRCFEKKIRYASRKRLAEQRPRIKGQFVRRTEDCEEEDDDDEETARDMSPESGVETQQVYSTALS